MKELVKLLRPLLIASFLTLFSCDQDPQIFENPSGPYFGQTPPDDTPELFAPGIVSTEMHEHSILAFSPNGEHVLWSSQFLDNFGFPRKIISSEIKNGLWTTPDFFKTIPLKSFSAPSFSPDGNRIYFTSIDSVYGQTKSMGHFDIWYIDKINNRWSEPKNPGAPINGENLEAYATQSKNGNLYFIKEIYSGSNIYKIFRSVFKDGQYLEPEILPESINSEHVDWTPFIAADESYILFSSHRPGGYGNGDLYISYRIKDNQWTDPINLGPKINSESQERFPSVSPDGKYLFFATNIMDEKLGNDTLYHFQYYRQKHMEEGNSWNDFYWVKAGIIKKLKPNSN